VAISESDFHAAPRRWNQIRNQYSNLLSPAQWDDARDQWDDVRDQWDDVRDQWDDVGDQWDDVGDQWVTSATSGMTTDNENCLTHHLRAGVASNETEISRPALSNS
jgi:hypothetical protein